MARKRYNLCPECGEVQFACPNGGYSCTNGHGFGDSNGPAANAGPCPGEASRGKVEPVVNTTMSAKLDGLGVGVYRVRVETGKMTFSPVQYNTFDVGSVMVETAMVVGLDNPDAVAQALESMRQVARAEFAAQYQQRLEFHVKAIKYNDSYLSKSKGK